MVLPDSPREGFSIDVIIKYSKGFLVGGQDCTVLYFESNPSDIKSVYRRLPQKIQVKKKKFLMSYKLNFSIDKSILM